MFKGLQRQTMFFSKVNKEALDIVIFHCSILIFNSNTWLDQRSQEQKTE
jgi:hypothetical protein